MARYRKSYASPRHLLASVKGADGQPLAKINTGDGPQVRGRFSKAAVAVLADARAKGVKFDSEVTPAPKAPKAKATKATVKATPNTEG